MRYICFVLSRCFWSQIGHQINLCGVRFIVSSITIHFSSIEQMLWHWLILLICLYVGEVMVLVYLYVEGRRVLGVGKRALSETFSNTLHCGKKSCPVPIVDLNAPSQSGKTYSTLMARYCADLVARVAYGVHHEGTILDPKGLKRLDVLYNLKDTPIFGVVWANEDTIWIAFRGTLTSDMEEWIQDFSFNQDDYVDKKQHQLAMAVKGGVARALRDTGSVPLIHAGFTEVYTSFKSKLYSILSSWSDSRSKKQTIGNKKPKNVIITGHSLGAACATVAGIDLCGMGYNCVVYNFASPYVGDDAMGVLVKASLPLFRHVNGADIVPTIPYPVSPNVDDPKQPYIYTHAGVLYEFTLNYQSIGNNHSMGTYIAAFDKDMYRTLE
jgi:hypothetical protein